MEEGKPKRPPKAKDPKGRDLPKGIYYDSKRGTYYIKETDADGNRPTVRFDTLSQAKEGIAEARRKRREGLAYNSKETLNYFFDKWYLLRKKSLADNSKNVYVSMWENHVRNFLGLRKVTEITASDCATMLSFLGETRSAAVVWKVHGLLSEAFGIAEDDHVISASPMQSRTVKQTMKNIGTLTSTDRSAPTRDEERQLLEAVGAGGKDLLYWKVVFLLHTGLRFSEFSGLTWGDIDMERRVLEVRRELLYISPEWGQPKRWTLGDGKTTAAHRRVYLDATAREALAQIKALSPLCLFEIDGLTGFVSVGAKSGKPTTESIFHLAVKRRIRRYNDAHPEDKPLRMLSPHLYRHSYSTRGTEKGVNPRAVAKSMGHGKASFTLDHYVQEDEDWVLDEYRQYDDEGE